MLVLQNLFHLSKIDYGFAICYLDFCISVFEVLDEDFLDSFIEKFLAFAGPHDKSVIENGKQFSK